VIISLLTMVDKKIALTLVLKRVHQFLKPLKMPTPSIVKKIFFALALTLPLKFDV
jgi:hypothetical protein